MNQRFLCFVLVADPSMIRIQNCSWSFNELILLHIYWVEKVYQSLQKKQKKEVNDTLTSQNHEDDKDNII